MTRRSFADDPERAHFVDPARTGDLPLFTEPTASIEAGMAALRDTAAKHEASIVALIPLAQELARTAWPAGVTVSNLRLAAVQRGLLTGSEKGRSLSFLGSVMRRAGLRPTGEYQRSAVVRSHGNVHMTWRLPSAAGGRGDAA